MTDAPRIVALILAAGCSSRMCAFKPLAPLGASTSIEEAVTRFFDAGIADVRVVVGYRADALTPVLDRMGVRWILNPEYDRGMFSSVLAGVKSFEPDVEAFFLLPADIPLVSPKTIRALREAYDRSRSKLIYPRFDGQRGHPPLIPAACLRGDMPLDLPGGLRAVLGGCENIAVDVDVVDEGILMDCDTPRDYRALLERVSREDLPTERECEALWSRLGVSGQVIAHSRLVAELARVLAVHLNGAGLALDLPLIVAAGLLHDIARDRSDHAKAAAELLAGMGYPRVGAVVAQHMDIQPHDAFVNEAELIYFADKCVEEDRLVPPEERFERSLSRYADRPDVRRNIVKRLEAAKNIGSRIEAVLQRPPEEVIRRYARSIRAASAGDCRYIYLVRHGAIDLPGNGKHFIGQLDLPLSREGLLQAGRLAEALREVPLSAVFCSDLKRSADTAEAIARPHGLSCSARRDLREIALGRWEGLTFEEVRGQYPQEFEARGRDIVHYRPPEGESFLDCNFRVIPAFHQILSSTRGNILLVGHAGVNRIILSQALGRSLEDLFGIGQEYGCLNVVFHRRQAFEVKLLNGSPSDTKRFLGVSAV